MLIWIHFQFNSNILARCRVQKEGLLKLTVDGSTNISLLKRRFEEKIGSLLKTIRYSYSIELSYRGYILDDDETLEYYAIKDGTRIEIEVIGHENFDKDDVLEGKETLSTKQFEIIDDCNKLLPDISMYKKMDDGLVQSNQRLVQTNQHLQLQIRKLQENSKRLSDINANLEEKVLELEGKSIRLGKKNQELQKQIDELHLLQSKQEKFEIDFRTPNLSQKMEKLVISDHEAPNQAKEFSKGTNKELEKLDLLRQVHASTTKIIQLQSENRQLAEKLATIQETMTHMKTTAPSADLSLLKKIGSLQEQYQQLETVKQNLKSKLDKLEIENGDLQARNNILESENDKLDDFIIEYRRLIKENADLRHKSNELQNELGRKKQHFSDYEIEMNRLAELSNTKSKKIQCLENQIDSMRKVHEKSIEVYLRKIRELEEKNNHLFKEFDSETKQFQKQFDELKDMQGDNLCAICMENERQIVFHPCMHMICCEECAPKRSQECSICRTVIKDKLRVFK